MPRKLPAFTHTDVIRLCARCCRDQTIDPKSFERIKGEDQQGCAGMMLSLMYPPRLMAVRAPSGEWQVVY